MAAAASSSSKPPVMPSSCKPIFLAFLFLIAIGSCTATRAGRMMMVEEEESMNKWTEMNPQEHKFKTSFQQGGQMFNFFPKGVPIPPSGPSKRHNSFVDSTPNNWINPVETFSCVSFLYIYSCFSFFFFSRDFVAWIYSMRIFFLSFWILWF